MNNNVKIKYKPLKHKFQIKHASHHLNFTLFYQSQPPKYFLIVRIQIIQSEVSQKDKEHYNILTHIYGI